MGTLSVMYMYSRIHSFSVKKNVDCYWYGLVIVKFTEGFHYQDCIKRMELNEFFFVVAH